MKWKDGYERVSGKDEKRNGRYQFQVAVAKFAWRNPLCTPSTCSAWIRTGSRQNRKEVCSTSTPRGPPVCQSLNKSESSLSRVRFAPSGNVKPQFRSNSILFNSLTLFQMWQDQGVLRVDDIVTCISVAREQLGKQVPAKKNSWPRIGK
jgi:hypothetical protein